jgi:hypothetical protein
MTFRGSSPPAGKALGAPTNGGEFGVPTQRAVEVDGGEIVLMGDADKILLWTPDLYDEVTMTVGQAQLLAAALLAAASDAETKS